MKISFAVLQPSNVSCTMDGGAVLTNSAQCRDCANSEDWSICMSTVLQGFQSRRLRAPQATWSLSQDHILKRVTNWNSIRIIQPQNCWDNNAVCCTAQCCSLQAVRCIKRMAALNGTTTKWPSHLSFARQITSCNEECWLLTTLERKRKKAEGKYRLIRSNWDPAGYPPPPFPPTYGGK